MIKKWIFLLLHTAAGIAAGLLSLLMQYLPQRALARADAEHHAADQGAAQTTLELVDHLEVLRTVAEPQRVLGRIEHSWCIQERTLEATSRAAAAATLVSTLSGVLLLAGMAAWAVLTKQDVPATVLALLILVARAAASLSELALDGLSMNDLRATLRDYQQVTRTPALPEPAPEDAVQPSGHAITLIAHPLCYMA